MAIHESASAWRDELPNRCQASLLCAEPRSAIPQMCEALPISPKRVRRTKGKIWPNPLASASTNPLPFKSSK